MPDRYDVAVIGGGSGGYVGAIRAAQLGLRVAVVETDKVGGTCLHCGCIPTKALLQTAALLDSVKNGGRLGVRAGEVSIDYAAASKNKRDVVTRLYKGVEFLLKKNKVEVIAGRGRLAGAGRVMVEGADGERELEAGSVMLATGSRARSLPGLDIDGTGITPDRAVPIPDGDHRFRLDAQAPDPSADPQLQAALKYVQH